MTPKEKAEELFNKIYNSEDYDGYCNGCGLVFQQAKDIALISVDEILNINIIKPYILHKEIIDFYIEVKQEIEKI
jgi:hypothetical protein